MASITLNVNRENTNVILGRETLPLYGRTYITDYIGNVKFQISPQSFFQVNPVQTEKLYSKALEFAGLTGKEVVWDLYCGIGTISLFLAQKAKKVFGVEIVPEAIEDAKRNAAINGIRNVEFFVGKAEEVVPAYYERHRSEQGAASQEKHRGYAQKEVAVQRDSVYNIKNNRNIGGEAYDALSPDVICVDPPRKGCDEKLLATMVQMAPEKIVYVSCDPATLARDVRYLTEHGYKIRKVQPVDQFGESYHVECVVLMSRVEK